MNARIIQIDSTSLGRIFLALLFLIVLISLFERPTQSISVSTKDATEESGDIRLWQDVVDRMRQGQPYYSAMEAALRTTGYYALRPFWNFRLPTLAYFMSLFKTNLVPRIMLVFLVIAMVVTWSKHLFQFGGLLSLYIGIVLFAFSFACAIVPESIVWHDVWAGILIALAVGLYKDNRTLSILFGLLALTLRIQVAAFIIVMGSCAFFERRRIESLVWFTALSLFGIFIAIHAYCVSEHVTDSDPCKSWVAYGGWAFVVSTARWTLPGILGLTIISKALMPVCFVSLAIWKHPSARRAAGTLLAFWCAFMVIGNPDNVYWGLLYAPLVSVGIACSPRAAKEIICYVSRKHN